MSLYWHTSHARDYRQKQSVNKLETDREQTGERETEKQI